MDCGERLLSHHAAGYTAEDLVHDPGYIARVWFEGREEAAGDGYCDSPDDCEGGIVS